MLTVEIPVSSNHSSQGKPQESLVLQVYGITPASRDFKERLHGTIQHKLEATTLDILCGLYARNQQLKLTPEDVTFLQPDFRRPSLTFHLPLPDWLGHGYRQAFFFYFLQMLSTFMTYPSYSSAERREHYQFQAHMELQDAYLTDGLSSGNTSDHLFLYIRPQNKGRGMAVVCVSLADPMGSVIGPLLGRTMHLKFEDRYLARLEEVCVVNEHMVFTGSHSIKLHVWEKGNIGIEEFMLRLSVSYRQSMYDYFLEVYLLASYMDQCFPLPDNYRSPDLPSVDAHESSLQQTSADLQIQHKKESVVSELHSSDLSRQSSDDLSRRGSENLFRCGPENLFHETASACVSERSCHHGCADGVFRRGSDNSSGLSSGRGSPSSTRKLSLTYSESRRTSGDQRLGKVCQSLSHWRQDQIGQPFHDQVIDGSEAPEHLLDESISSVVSLGHERMEKEAKMGGRESQLAQAVKGTWSCGVESNTAKSYSVLTSFDTTIIPSHLYKAQRASCPSVRYLNLPILGNHSTLVFVSQALVTLSVGIPEFTFSAFQHTPFGYVHYTSEKEWTQVTKREEKRLLDTSFVIIGRSMTHWRHCKNAGETSSMDASPDSPAVQLFASLDSMHPTSSFRRTPLQSAAMVKEVFVPRRSLVFLQVNQRQVITPMYVCVYVWTLFHNYCV